MSDYVADLGFYSAETIQQACAQWRARGKPKFPTVAEMIVICATISVSPTKDVDEWRPLLDFEFDELTLREKIRHHRILAERAFDAAGPIYARLGRNIKDLREDADYRAMERAEQNHLAEAKRLNAILLERAN